MCLSTLQAGLRQIHLKSYFTSDKDEDVHELTMLDDVHISSEIVESMPIGSHDETEHSFEFSANMSDINVKLTKRQYVLLMTLFQRASILWKADTEVPLSEIAPDGDGDKAARALDAVETQSPKTHAAILQVAGDFTLKKVCLDLYDETAVDAETLGEASLFCLSLIHI